MLTIISGAQTGVDRGALDAALLNNISCGGWCPKGRKAEDGFIPDKYPVQETSSENYRVRTRKNVIDSDATVIIFFGELSGGTALTVQYCRKVVRPYLLIDAQQTSAEQAGADIARFVQQHHVTILNVAGPRASRSPQAHDYTQSAISAFIKTTL